MWLYISVMSLYECFWDVYHLNKRHMYTMPDNSLTWTFLEDNILAPARLGHNLRETPRFGNYPLHRKYPSLQPTNERTNAPTDNNRAHLVWWQKRQSKVILLNLRVPFLSSNQPVEFSIQLLRDMIEECVDLADENNLTTVAFPTLGCGKLKYPVTEVIRCFMEVARLYPNVKVSSGDLLKDSHIGIAAQYLPPLWVLVHPT